jgi:hypothetical protein
MDTKEIKLTAMESRLVKEFQTLRAAVTKNEMLAAIAKSRGDAWCKARTQATERKGDAIWAEIEAAVLRDCERREAEPAAEANGRKAA